MLIIGTLFRAVGTVVGKAVKNTYKAAKKIGDKAGGSYSKVDPDISTKKDRIRTDIYHESIKQSKVSSEVRDLQSEILRIKSNLENYNNELNYLNEENSSLNNELLNIESDKELLSEKRKSGEVDKESANLDMKNLIERKRDTLKRIQEIKDQINEINQEKESDNILLTELENNITSKKSDLKDLNEKIYDLKSDKEDLEEDEKISIKERIKERNDTIAAKVKKIEKFLDNAIVFTILTPIILKILHKLWTKFIHWVGEKICDKMYAWASSRSGRVGGNTAAVIYWMFCALFGIPKKEIFSRGEVSKKTERQARRELKKSREYTKEKDYKITDENFKEILSQAGISYDTNEISSSDNATGVLKEISSSKTSKLIKLPSIDDIKKENIYKRKFNKTNEEEVALGHYYYTYLGFPYIAREVKRISKILTDDIRNNKNLEKAQEFIKTEVIKLPFAGYIIGTSSIFQNLYNIGDSYAMLKVYYERLWSLLNGINSKIDWHQLKDFLGRKGFLEVNFDLEWDSDQYKKLGTCTREEIENTKRSILYYLSFSVDKLKFGEIVDDSEFYEAYQDKLSLKGRFNSLDSEESVDSNQTENDLVEGQINGVKVGDDLNIEVKRDSHEVDEENPLNNPVYGKVYVNGEYIGDSYENAPLNPGTYKLLGSKKYGASVSGKALKSSETKHPWWYHMRKKINETFPNEKDGDYIPEIKADEFGRTGIRIHPSTGQGLDSEGCLTVGKNEGNKFNIEKSKETWDKLMPYLHESADAKITYTDPSGSSYKWNDPNSDEGKNLESQDIVENDAGGDGTLKNLSRTKPIKGSRDKGGEIESNTQSISEDKISKKLDVLIKLQLQTLGQATAANMNSEEVITPKEVEKPFPINSSFDDFTHYQNLA